MNKDKYKRKFPPKKLNFLTKKSASNFLSLQNKVSFDKITLFLGCGVSKSAGLPDWYGFLKNICISFFNHWFFGIKENKLKPSIPPDNLSIAFTEDIYNFFDNQSEIVKKFLSTDLVILAQQIKNCIRPIDWDYLLHKSLYPNIEFSNDSNLLISLVKLVIILKNNLSAVINYNFDDAFETNLRKENIKFKTISDQYDLIDKNKLNIFHPHGYLPFSGGRKCKRMIICEVDYQSLSNTPLSRENNIQLSFFFNSTCIFVGLSMSDPNLRKLLRIASSYSNKIHFAFINEEPKEDLFYKMSQALFDKDLEQMRVKVIRYPLINDDKDPFKFLPLLLEYLKNGIEDNNFIWK